ncbi:oligosaccharide flippase family protein [Dactylosporangium sp. CA-139066]|uniref:oligosaccharide flippase family protein n=1 Tax=Dactylosporangium sp. CA-139066 TaxID=3239930 RepID=UPI003D8F938B
MTNTEEIQLIQTEIGDKAGRGLKWSLVGTLGAKVGSFAMGLVLARLLEPSDYGTFGIATAALAVLMHINDVGLIAAVVQWRGKLEDMAPTAATLAAVFGVVVYGIFYVTAPAYSAFSGEADAVGVVRLLTVVIVIDGLTAVRSAALMREFRQDKMIIANTVGLGFQIVVSIWLAIAGAHAYAFAWGQVAGAVVGGLLTTIFAKVPLRFGYNREIAKKLLKYGFPLAVSLGIEAIVMNVQLAIVGRISGQEQLGFYVLAFNMSMWAQTILGTAIRYVSVAGFSRLSETDDRALAQGVHKYIPMLVSVVAPIIALMSVLATPLVTLLYGGKWSPAGPALMLLVGLTFVRMVTGLAMDALMGAGATRSTLWIYLGWSIALVPALWIATESLGINGAAIAQTGIGLLVGVPLTAIALQRAKVALRPMGPPLVRPLLSTVLAAAVAAVVAHFTGPYPVVQLLAGGTVGLLVYVPLVVPRDQLRRLPSTLLRRGGSAPIPEEA